MFTQSGIRRILLNQKRETLLVILGIALIATYLVADAFLQPEAGVSARDHLISGGVPILLLVIIAASYSRLRIGFRSAITLGLGLLSFGVGIAVPVFHTVTEGPSGDDYSGLVATIGGLLLVLVGVTMLWQTRRTDERKRRRYARRILTCVLALVLADELLMPVGFAFVLTHLPRSSVSAIDLGAPYDEVELTTSDGLKLAAWYVPSRNGAAIIVFPGRSGPGEHARMLVRHGYGVLMLDRRGTGESEGDGFVLGWNGEKDIIAALDFLNTRPDVKDGRIGGLGLSVGGEILLQTAARTDGLRAVVSEGAGVRSIHEQMVEITAGDWLLFPQFFVFNLSAAIFSNQTPPPYLGDLVGMIAPRPVFLIYSTHGQGREELNPAFFENAGEPREIWAITDAGHTDGLSAHPEEYERRVIAFFDKALLGDL